jgi:hypothetical protein
MPRVAVTGVAKQAFGWVSLKLIEHVGHGHQEPIGFGRHSGVVDHRADQEDDEVTLELGRPPTLLDSHDVESLSNDGRCLRSHGHRVAGILRLA